MLNLDESMSKTISVLERMLNDWLNDIKLMLLTQNHRELEFSLLTLLLQLSYLLWFYFHSDSDRIMNSSILLFYLICTTIVVADTAESQLLNINPKKNETNENSVSEQKLSNSEIRPDYLNQVNALNKIVLCQKGYLVVFKINIYQ